MKKKRINKPGAGRPKLPADQKKKTRVIYRRVPAHLYETCVAVLDDIAGVPTSGRKNPVVNPV